MKKIDCLGDMCPLPVMKVQKELKQILQGEKVLIVTDHSCAKQNVADYCKGNQLQFDALEVITGVWEITVYKS